MVQLELGEDIESRLLEAARNSGVSVDGYVQSCVAAKLPRKHTPKSLDEQRQAVKELSTFAKDRNINIEIPGGTSMRDYIAEACGF